MNKSSLSITNKSVIESDVEKTKAECSGPLFHKNDNNEDDKSIQSKLPLKKSHVSVTKKPERKCIEGNIKN